jgi:hypothetical protein
MGFEKSLALEIKRVLQTLKRISPLYFYYSGLGSFFHLSIWIVKDPPSGNALEGPLLDHRDIFKLSVHLRGHTPAPAGLTPRRRTVS